MSNETDFPNSGIEYKATGEVVEEINASSLHTENIALRKEARLNWTEEIGKNLVNLDGVIQCTLSCDEIVEIEDRMFEVENIERHLVLPKDEVIEAASRRAAEDATNIGYVLGNWAYQAEKAQQMGLLDRESKARLEYIFQDVINSDNYDTANNAEIEAGGGRYNE